MQAELVLMPQFDGTVYPSYIYPLVALGFVSDVEKHVSEGICAFTSIRQIHLRGIRGLRPPRKLGVLRGGCL